MQIAELRFGDVGRGVSHYKPVAFAVVAIVVMGLTLPGPKRVASNVFDTSFHSSPPAVAPPVDVPEGEPSGEVAAAVSAIGSSPDSFSTSFSSRPSSYSSPASPSAFTSDATVTRAETRDEPAATTHDSSTPAVTEDRSTATAPQPLKVATAAWASAQAGTPLASSGVPAGSLPVGRRIGFDIDKAAFVRLSGTATTLKLVPHEDASGQRSADAAQLKACPITSTGWQKAEAQPMADAPKWDCTVSVLGKRAADGSWAFDLSVFPDRSDARGFALLPAGGPADYQVAFRLG